MSHNTKTIITTSTAIDSTPNHWNALQEMLDKIDALPGPTLDNLSGLTQTDEPFATTRMLYRMAVELTEPGKSLARHLEGERSPFLRTAYAMATLRDALADPDVEILTFREWCLRAALDAEDTIDYALALLGRVRPPNRTWSDWLAEIANMADENE